MKSLCEQRMRLMNESADTLIAQSHQERNRYQNITALLKSQPGSDYFNGNICELGRFRFLIT